MRNLRVRWESNVRNGVCSLETNNKYEPLKKLVASTTYGGINVFDFSDTHTGGQSAVSCISKLDADELPAIQRNHINNEKNAIEITPTIWCVRHLPQNRHVFATCGGSGNVRIWCWYVKCVKSQNYMRINVIEFGQLISSLFEHIHFLL